MKREFRNAVKSALLMAMVVLVFAGPGRASENVDGRVIASYMKGMLAEQKGDYKRAEKEYLRALSMDPQNAFVRVKFATHYLRANNFDKAIEELKIASEARPDMVEPHAILALVYYLQNDPEKAIEEYEAALEKASSQKPADMEIYRSLGRLYLYHGKLDKAAATYKKAVALRPSSAEFLFYLADVFYRQGDKKASEEELKKAIAADPQYHQALNYLGYMYIEEGRNLKQAEELVKKAVSLEPDNGAYADSLGWLYFKKGMLKEAGRELERAVLLLEDPEIYDHLGDFYLKSGNKKKAAENWEKSLELNPEQETVRNKLRVIKPGSDKTAEPDNNAK